YEGSIQSFQWCDAVFGGLESAGRLAAKAGFLPVIDEIGEARSLQWPPIEQYTVAALNGRKGAPFVGGIFAGRFSGGEEYGCDDEGGAGQSGRQAQAVGHAFSPHPNPLLPPTRERGEGEIGRAHV